MSNEYWREIQKAQKQILAEETKKNAQKLANEDRLKQQQAESLIKEQEKERIEKQKEDEKKQLILSGQRSLLKIFQDIKDNSPEIRNAPLSEAFIVGSKTPVFKGLNFRYWHERVFLRLPYYEHIVIPWWKENQEADLDDGTVILRWGNKFDLTDYEREIVTKYMIKPKFFSSHPSIPDKIILRDYSCIHAKISEETSEDWSKYADINFGADYGSFPRDEFFNDQKKIIPTIARILEKPEHFKHVLHKDLDYYRNKWLIHSEYSGSSSLGGNSQNSS